MLQWREHLIRRLDHDGIQTPEKWSREDELKKIFSLFEAGIVPADEELTEKSLALIERIFPLKENFGRQVAEVASKFIADLPLEDPAMNRRIQGLLTKKAIRMTHTENFIHMVEKMPAFTEEFKGFLDGEIRYFKQTEKSQPSEIWRDQIQRIEALRAKAEKAEEKAGNPLKPGCSGQFSQITP